MTLRQAIRQLLRDEFNIPSMRAKTMANRIVEVAYERAKKKGCRYL